MSLKLDVLINYIFDNTKLKNNIARMNKQMVSAWSPFTRQNILAMGQGTNIQERFNRLNISAKQFNDMLKNNIEMLKKMDKNGDLASYAQLISGRSNRIHLKPKELKALAYAQTNQQVTELQNAQREEEKNLEALQKKQYEKNVNQMMSIDREEFNKKLKEQEEKQKEYMANVMSMLSLDTKLAKEELKDKKEKEQQDKWLSRENERLLEEQSKEDAKREKEKQKAQADYWLARDKYEKKQLEKQSKEDEKKKKKLFDALLMRWGKFGVAGIAISKLLQLGGKAIHFGYNTSQQALDWQRTISGGASGGSFFGSKLASYQAAGISGNSYQGFKRGMQSYIGSVKLGQGNAAPLMYLGLSALDNLDNLETQIEEALQRLPADISLALAGQMGIDYNMWEAIYNGELESKYKYNEEAIQEWKEVGRKLNEMLTWFSTTIFNNTSGVVNALVTGKSNRVADEVSFWTNPFDFVNRVATYGATQGFTKTVNIVINGVRDDITELTTAVKDAFMQSERG